MEWFNGCLFSVDERDFLLGWDININDLPNITTSTYEYNQLEWKDEFWYCTCTIYAPIWIVSDNANRVLTDKQRKELVTERVNLPDFNPNVWWYLSEWINITRKYYKSLWYKVSSLQVNVKTDLIKLLDKGYRVNIWMIVKDDFIVDSQKDWILNNLPKWNSKYWHSTSVKKIKDSYIVDNYKWTHTYNKILLKDLQGLIDDWVIYEHAYILFLDKQDIILNFKNKLMEDIRQSAKDFINRGYMKAENMKQPITKEDMATIFERVLVANNLK